MDVAAPLVARQGKGAFCDPVNDNVIAVNGRQDPISGEVAGPVDTFQNTECVCFKPSHYTRDKDGAPSEVVPPLSADADRGDQEPVVFESRFARNGRGAPEPVCPPLKAESGKTGKGDSAPLVAMSTPWDAQRTRVHDVNDVAPVLSSEHGVPTVAMGLSENQRGEVNLTDVSRQITTGGGKPGQGYPAAMVGSCVRRLTARECERLMGFPDDFTLIPYGRNKVKDMAEMLEYWRLLHAGLTEEEAARLAADGPRYRALGNSMAVPVMRWLGQRIASVERCNPPG